MSPSLPGYLYKVVLKVEDVNEKEQKTPVILLILEGKKTPNLKNPTLLDVIFLNQESC